MKKHHVMINVDRPLIVYKSMSFNIFQTGIDHINIELIESTLEVDGKRGNVCFIFSMSSNGSVIGKGMKTNSKWLERIQ